MPVNIPKFVFISGDPVLAMDQIVALKKQWFEQLGNNCEWVELELPDKALKLVEFFNTLDGEVSTGTWIGNKKFVLVRGLQNNKPFCSSLLAILKSVSPENTVVLFDESNVVSFAKNKSSAWDDLKKFIEEKGLWTSVLTSFEKTEGIPWGARYGNKHVDIVVEEFKKRKKQISRTLARELVLDLSMHDWSYLFKEIDKIAEASESNVISEETIMGSIFPWSNDYAIYELCIVINTGTHADLMECYDKLVAAKYHNEVIFFYCQKMLRWQLMAVHLKTYNTFIDKPLAALAELMTKESFDKRFKGVNFIKEKWRKEFADYEVNFKSKEDKLSNFVTKQVSTFVTEKYLTNKQLLYSDPVAYVIPAMTRYLIMVNAVEQLRLSNLEPRVIFEKATRRLFSALAVR